MELTVKEVIEKVKKSIKKNGKRKQYIAGLKEALKYIKKIDVDKQDEDFDEPNYLNEYDRTTGLETTQWR